MLCNPQPYIRPFNFLNLSQILDTAFNSVEQKIKNAWLYLLFKSIHSSRAKSSRSKGIVCICSSSSWSISSSILGKLMLNKNPKISIKPLILFLNKILQGLEKFVIDQITFSIYNIIDLNIFLYCVNSNYEYYAPESEMLLLSIVRDVHVNILEDSHPN